MLSLLPKCSLPFSEEEMIKPSQLCCQRPRQNQISFSSNVFEDYVQQLSVFNDLATKHLCLTKEFFKKMPVDLYLHRLKAFIVQICNRPKLKYEKAVRFHLRTLKLVRALAISNRFLWINNQPLEFYHYFARKLCSWIYKSVNLSTAFDQFFQQTLSLDVEVPVMSYSKYIEFLKNQIVSHLELPVTVNNAEDGLDRHLADQLPFRAFTCKKKHFLYLSSPLATIFSKEHPQGQLKIVPEFSEFLYDLEAKEKKLLNVVLVNRQTKTGSFAAKVYERIDSEDHFDSYFAITLDFTSNFYLQTNAFSQIELTASKFKVIFLQQMFEDKSDSYFYWPQKMDQNLLKQQATFIINEVLVCYFNDKANLTIDERKIIIDQVYVRLVMAICHQFDISFCGVCCSNQIDHTSYFLTLMYVTQNLIGGRLEEEQLKTSSHLYFIPAMLTDHRLPLPNHHQRLMANVKWMEEKF